MNKHEFSHADAKRIISHFNEKFGICHHCNYEQLKTENISCPKCRAYNYNCEVGDSFDQKSVFN
jgi:Zn finger protein HypA/HybF involved in hydrogenase expression